MRNTTSTTNAAMSITNRGLERRRRLLTVHMLELAERSRNKGENRNIVPLKPKRREREGNTVLHQGEPVT